jgi:hypothetical protein
MKSVRRREWFQIQKGVCCLCKDPQRPMSLDPRSGKDFATFEHGVPRSKGGNKIRTGVPLAHRDCNGQKGNGKWLG